MSSPCLPEFLLSQSVVNCFENQAPLVVAACRLAVATCGAGLALPDEDGIQLFAAQWLLAIDCGHEAFGVFDVLAHARVAGVAGGGNATLLENRIALCARAELDGVVEGERAAHVGAGGAFVAEGRVERAVGVGVDGKTFVCPALQGSSIDGVGGVPVEHRNDDGKLLAGRA